MANNYFNHATNRAPDGVLPLGSHINLPAGEVEQAFDLIPTKDQVELGTITIGIDGGPVNFLTANLSPPVTSYVEGMEAVIVVGTSNTGATQLSLNNVGFAPVKRIDGQALQALDLVAGMYALVRFDGTNFQLLNPHIPSIQISGNQVASRARRMDFTSGATLTDNGSGAVSVALSEAVAVSPGSSQLLGVDWITSSGVWVPPAGTTWMEIALIGAGGGGGWAYTGADQTIRNVMGSGGGGGGVALWSGAASGGLTLSLAAGGAKATDALDSSLVNVAAGINLQCGGGGGGTITDYRSGGSTNGAGGAGGAATGGLINHPGMAGDNGGPLHHVSGWEVIFHQVRVNSIPHYCSFDRLWNAVDTDSLSYAQGASPAWLSGKVDGFGLGGPPVGVVNSGQGGTTEYANSARTGFLAIAMVRSYG